MAFIFSVIAHFQSKRRLQFVEAFLLHNKDFEDFQNLPLEPNTWGWSGSAVPIHQERAIYFKSILSLLNDVQLLRHRQHIEEIIRGIEVHIKWERKRDFMEDIST
jgi:hypothetical protein